MSNYFINFPTVIYDSETVVDITRRASLSENTSKNPYVFLPYTVKDNEKPEDIAYYYYGDVGYTWLVLFSNKIIDPYFQWFLDESDFNNFLIEKYKEKSKLEGYNVIRWCQSEEIYQNVVFFYKEDNNFVIKAAPESFGQIIEDPSYLSPFSNAFSPIQFGRGRNLAFSNSFNMSEFFYDFNVKPDVPPDWKIMRIYEYEQILNNNKKEIQLIDKDFLLQVEKEFETVLEG